MKKSFERVIVTNNPAAVKFYDNSDKVMFMKDATPYEVYSRVRDLLENGGKLIKPNIKNPTEYYTTVGVFYDGKSEPTPWNIREIEAACRATKDITSFNSGKTLLDQKLERWKDGPEPNKAA